MGFLSTCHNSAAWRLTVLWMIYYPLFAAFVSVILAGPIAALEGCSFMDSYHWMLQSNTAAAFPLTTWAGPTGTIGIILTNCIAIIHQILLAIFVGISAGPMIEALLDVGSPCFNSCDPDGSLLVPRTRCGFFLKLIAFFFILVIFSSLASIFLGGMLALAEGYSFAEGFVFSLGIITSGNTVLAGTPTVETTAGAFVGFYVGIAGAAMLGLIIAVASVPMLGVDLSCATHVPANVPCA